VATHGSKAACRSLERHEENLKDERAMLARFCLRGNQEAKASSHFIAIVLDNLHLDLTEKAS
jgi:hypothetical protein